MQHKNLTTRASAVKRFALTTAVAAAVVATIATTTAFSSHPATPAAARPAAARLATASPAASPESTGAEFMVIDDAGRLIAIAKVVDGKLVPTKVLACS